MNRIILVALALVALATPVAPRATQAGPLGLGPRVGFSSGPDQFILGLGLVQPIAKNIELAPSFDFGFGDGGNSMSLNGDLRYNFAAASKLKPYGGAGLTWISYNPDGPGDSSSDIGVNLLGGIWLNKGHWPEFNIEARVGLSNVPDFEGIVGFNIF